MKLKQNRLLVIGLDGATFDLIEPWIADGRLPNIAYLIKHGCSGPLRSTIQPTTAPAWTTCLTGVNQGKHGLYDFVTRRQESYNLEITSSTHIKAPSIFDFIGQQGGKVVGINIPYTAPPKPVNGVLIGGPFAPTVTPDLFYPRNYYEKILQLVPNYFVLPDFNSRAPDPMGDYADKLLTGIANREKIALHLLQNESWDFFMIVFMATDEVQHTFWHCLNAKETDPEYRYRQTIFQVYERLDEAIGKLRAAAEISSTSPLSTFIVSDHGAGHFSWMINLNQWLASAGFLQFRQDKTSTIRKLKTNIIKQIALGYRRYLPGKLRATIRSYLGAKRFEQVKGEFESTLVTSNIVWEHTKAYALGAGGNIYVNLAGREPKGIVQSGTPYDQVCEQLIAQLMLMRDPDSNEPMIKQVHRREDLYSGPFLHQAPDLIIEWADYAYWGRGQYDSQAPTFQKQRHLDFSDQPLTGSHRPEGILIAHGPGIRQGTNVQKARLLDLAPTLLGMLGIQATKEMDGRFLSMLFDEAYADQIQSLLSQTQLIDNTQPSDHKYTAEEEAIIAEHLRSLGYL